MAARQVMLSATRESLFARLLRDTARTKVQATANRQTQERIADIPRTCDSAVAYDANCKRRAVGVRVGSGCLVGFLRGSKSLVVTVMRTWLRRRMAKIQGFSVPSGPDGWLLQTMFARLKRKKVGMGLGMCFHRA